MDKFVCIKCIENKEDILIKHKFVSVLPQYFKNKYIIKKNPYNIEQVSFMEVSGFEVTLNFLQSEIQNEKVKNIIENMFYDLYEREVCVAFSDMKLEAPNSNILFLEGNTLISFFIWSVIKKALKYTNKDIQYIEIVIIDNEDAYSAYNIIEALYEEVNYMTIFTKRVAYFEKCRDQVYSDTGLNLQILEKNKAFLKDADVIINLSDSLEENYDYFYKSGAIYIDLSKNENKTLELLRKRNDINVIDNVLMSIDNKMINNSKLEAVLYIKSRAFRDYIHYNKYDGSKESINNIIKNEKLTIAGFYQYRNIIRQYKS